MRSTYLIFGQPQIEQAEIDEVVGSLRAGWLGTGPKVAAFEKRVADYMGVTHAVAVNSCTAGLHLASVVLGLEPGDEVIVPALTFCATANAVIHAGATPVPVDVARDTFNIDVEDVRRKITPRTKAIIPVHFAGRPCDMHALMRVAREHDLQLIEDCAHAVEAEYDGRRVGSFGELGVLSFYSTKNVVTGEGGMILTNSADIASKVKVMALHGMSADAWKRFSDDGYKHYEVVEIGFRYNMMDLQAAIGLHQIERVEANWQRRAHVWKRYNEAFADLPVTRPAPIAANTRHALHLYTLLIDGAVAPVTRDQFILEMHRRNIGTGVHYRPLPVHPVYRARYGWRSEDYPHADAIGQQTVSLPFSARLADGDVEDVIRAVRATLGGGR